MALASTGLTASSPQNFVIDAATIFTDFAFDGTDFTGTSLGATSGGVTVNIETNYRQIEVDGASRMNVKGLPVLESAFCKITAPLKEFGAEALRRSLNGTISAAKPTEAPAGYQKITTKRYVEDGDYIPAIGVVGKLSTGQAIVFVAHNCLVTNALELAFEDGGEAVIEQELTAHASIDEVNADRFPWAIYYPGAKAPTVASALPTGRGAHQQITLNGSGFLGTTGVTIGGTAVEAFTVVSDSRIVVTLPTGAAGAVDIVVTTPKGASAAISYTRAV